MDTCITKLSDSALAAGSVKGQKDCFEEIVRRYSSKLLSFVLSKHISMHDSEDIVQETFISAWTHIHSFNPKYQLSTWLFTIAFNKSMNLFRYNHNKKTYPITENISSPLQPTKDRDENTETVWAQVCNLKKVHRDVLWLKYKEDMPVKEIAAVMGKKQVNIRVLLHRARTNLANNINATNAAINMNGSSREICNNAKGDTKCFAS